MAVNSKEDALKALSDVNPEHNFWVCDGGVLKSINDLLSVLKKMNKNVFQAHVNKEKNDFANWINDIIKDEKLAKELYMIKDRRKIISKVTQRIAWLKQKAK
ncbi:hypothetical protein FP803_02470 [Candidatus Woesearchaeota archaeon]|nr:hypothetical protein [Candidatus Woesearchaeota archaeon]MBU3941317.1 hypothetical protein [Nanoarchaeota archaeon]